MTFTDLLIEYILPSTFKIGFELEAYYGTFTSKYEGFQRYAMGTFGGDFGEDSSITSDEQMNFKTFEYKSGILDFTPATLQKIITFFSSLKKYGVKTNFSCGLHFHFSYPNMTSRDAFWVLCQLAMSPEDRKNFTDMGKYHFVNREHASSSFLTRIEGWIEAKNFDGLFKEYSNEKYNLFRIHPQGTLEWRGPRDFLNEGNIDDIKEFIRKLYDVVHFISRAVDKTTIEKNGEVLIKKTDFDRNEKNKMEDREAKKPIFKPYNKKFEEMNKDMRFTPGQDKKVLDRVHKQFPWFFKGKFVNASVGIADGELEWFDGRWLDGTFESGYWHAGVFKNGIFKGHWIDGRWLDGKWEGIRKTPEGWDKVPPRRNA